MVKHQRVVQGKMEEFQGEMTGDLGQNDEVRRGLALCQ